MPNGGGRRSPLAWMSAFLIAATMVGCTLERPSTAPLPPDDNLPPAVPGPRPVTVTPSAGPRPITDDQRSTRTNALPVVLSLTAVPTEFFAPPCGPPIRPTVTARVADADDPAGSLQVRLSYTFRQRYQGDVDMMYDRVAKAFTYRLPLFEQHHNPDRRSGHIVGQIIVRDPKGSDQPPSTLTLLVTVNTCITVSNGAA
jgi:hypothetical protein